MYFNLTEGALPAIASRWGIETADLAATMEASVASSVPPPPGCDDVSRKITERFFVFSTGFYDKTVQGVGHRIHAQPHLPAVDACYRAADATGSGEISARSAALGE
ncbi:hypothetical protein ABZW96_36905 [Nocardia sp. NPDC004168]|uniref:hypothetical protein n=1 Tax=Nocardia sp. NPDC004168 TaxID=3154452 RepID=UPI0033AE87BD